MKMNMMKPCITMLACLLSCLFSCSAFAQGARRGFGIKAGFNIVNVKNLRSVSDAGSGSRAGFMAGAYLAPPSRGIMGYRSELIFSRQGYDFKTSRVTGDMIMDYILLPQLMTINISKFLQVQAGVQVSFLIKAKADSVSTVSMQPGSKQVMDYYNRLNYGVAGGIELNPVGGLIIGGRYNTFFGSLTDQYAPGAAGLPSFIPRDGRKLKNSLVQFYIGYQF